MKLHLASLLLSTLPIAAIGALRGGNNGNENGGGSGIFDVRDKGGDDNQVQSLPNGNGNGNSNGGSGNGSNNGDIIEDDVADNYLIPDVDESNLPPPEVTDADEDFDAIADTMGLSRDDAIELLKQQEDFAELVDLLQEDNNFLQAEMPATPNGEFVIKYKNGNVPKKRDDDIEQFKAKNKNAKVKKEASKLSLKDAEGRGERLVAKLEKKGYSNASYAIDGDGLDIIAKKSASHDKNQDKGRIPRNRAAEILEIHTEDADLDEFALTLTEYDDEDPVVSDHTYGGRKIRSSTHQCTTGFSVESIGSGVSGVATAAHCTGMNVYDAVSPEADYSTYFQGQHRGSYGDVEWHRTSHFNLAEYYATPSTRWPVRSVGTSISKGQWICSYSRMQGTRKCLRVESTSISVQYTGLPRMYNIVLMDGANMIGGDSGGPWSYSSTAYGIHSGTRTTNGVRKNMWSRVSYLPAALGVRVRTQ